MICLILAMACIDCGTSGKPSNAEAHSAIVEYISINQSDFGFTTDVEILKIEKAYTVTNETGSVDVWTVFADLRQSYGQSTEERFAVAEDPASGWFVMFHI